MRRKPVVISTPFPTREEMRLALGISRKRAVELSKLADEVYKRQISRESRETPAVRKQSDRTGTTSNSK